MLHSPKTGKVQEGNHKTYKNCEKLENMEAKKQNFECTSFDCLNISVNCEQPENKYISRKKKVSNHV